ncbi:MAG: serine/threonine-protein kinase, partial [Acidobacteriota bacterium]
MSEHQPPPPPPPTRRRRRRRRASPADAFDGTDRFLVQQRLGAGAFGVVYEAYDRQQDRVVALKVLRHAEAESLYRFKRGFRSLTDIRHDNLVTFYELITEGDLWMLSLERIDGVDYITALRGAADARASDPAQGQAPTLGGDQQHDTEVWQGGPLPPSALVPNGLGGAPAPGGGDGEADHASHDDGPLFLAVPPVDYERVRAATRQLALGLQTLHQHGKLHRDIKPSNVLVERDTRRVVLLDFGLVAELGPQGTHESAVREMVGTPVYMAPEQGEGKPATPASDWYSVGVMLYEALTRARPFSDVEGMPLLMVKQVSTPPPPSEVVAEVPADLDALCMALLAR